VFLGANTTNKKSSFASSAGARRRWWPGTSTGFTPPVIPPPVSVDGVWLGGWYVACGGGRSKTPVMGPTKKRDRSRCRCRRNLRHRAPPSRSLRLGCAASRQPPGAARGGPGGGWGAPDPGARYQTPPPTAPCAKKVGSEGLRPRLLKPKPYKL
jgi:hypothetical protein